MPKRKICEHPTKHADSTYVPKGTMAVPLELSKFLVPRYNLTGTKVHWLCPRCRAFESKEMMNHQTVQMSDPEVSSEDDDDDVMMVELVNNSGTDEDGEDNDDDKEENNPEMDSGFIHESEENDHCLQDTDKKSANSGSMEDEEDTVLYEDNYRKNKAVDELSSVFQLLKIEPIHDKYDFKFNANFQKRLLCLDQQYFLFGLKWIKSIENSITCVMY